MDDQPPREFVHMCTLYDLLVEKSVDNVFIGSVTALVTSMNVSHAYYTRLPRLLVQLGCIERQSKGAGGKPGVVVLFRRPTLDEYLTTYKRKHLTRSPQLDTIKAAIETTNRRLPSIDIPRWMQSVEVKLSELEARVVELETSDTKGGTSIAS